MGDMKMTQAVKQLQKQQIKRQLQFVKWMQDEGIYNHLASARAMQDMQAVWEHAQVYYSKGKENGR
jgi:hypothetical protein